MPRNGPCNIGLAPPCGVCSRRPRMSRIRDLDLGRQKPVPFPAPTVTGRTIPPCVEAEKDT